MTWFHSIESEAQVLALYDYLEAMLEAKSPLPLPPILRDNVFNGFVGSESDAVYLSVLSH